MKLVKDVKALSKLSIIILLLISLILGALLSYLWVMGYYLTLGIKIPDKTSLTISNIAFNNQNTSYFNVTFFNPSYSPSAANVIGIAVKTPDNKIYNVTQSTPQTPYVIPKAQETAFKCTWNWANYTGQEIGVVAFIDNGSGPTKEDTTPYVGLTIKEAIFNASISITHFNITIENPTSSATYVNISSIVAAGTFNLATISPALPYRLNANQNKTFRCTWNWTDYQNKSISIAAYTTQGYAAYYTKTTPKELRVEIVDAVFSEPDLTHFNLTVRNREGSPTSVNINKITVTLENATVKEINRTQTTPILPYKLNSNSTVTFRCQWDWTLYRGKKATVTIYTAQNYTTAYTKTTQPPIEITSTIFDAADTNIFNVTVHNSALYHEHVNITNIIVTFENGTMKEIGGTSVTPTLPRDLSPSSSVTFRCTLNWTAYQGRTLTITAKTSENQITQVTKVTPKRVIMTITSISFDSVNTTIFEVTVRNSALAIENADITKITVTFENGTTRELTGIMPSLPYSLSPNAIVKFTCQLDWTNYRGKNITITVYAAKGYVDFSLYTTPRT